MPVDTKHPDYARAMARWVRCRDAHAGTDAIKAKRTEYLPKLIGQTEPEYDAYLKRALYYPSADRTVMGLSGMVVRKAPSVKCPEEIEPQLADVTLSNVSLDEFALRMLTEVLVTGRGGISVDLPAVASETARPYWVHWQAEQIINWRTGKAPNGSTRLTMVVLYEKVPKDIDADPFAVETVDQYRMLSLVNNVYVVTLWRRSADGQGWVSQPPIVPQRRGRPLDFIPFSFVGPRNIEPACDKPPLADLVDVNLSHYLSSADLEHGRHWTALPTPWVTGFVDTSGGTAPLAIGSAAAWTFGNPETRVGMLEFTGQGLQALEKALDAKEKMMAVLGARMLEQQPRTQETATSVVLRQSGEHASLSTVTSSLSRALSKALGWHVWWTGYEAPVGEEPSIVLNTDFLDTSMTAQEVTALMGLWQSGAISYETFYYNLQRGEWARPQVTVEEEREAIASDEAQASESALEREPPPDDALPPEDDPDPADPEAGDAIDRELASD